MKTAVPTPHLTKNYVCATCRYGISVGCPPDLRCPMCGGGTWVPYPRRTNGDGY